MMRVVRSASTRAANPEAACARLRKSSVILWGLSESLPINSRSGWPASGPLITMSCVYDRCRTVQEQARVVGNNKDAVTEEEKNIEWQGKQRTSRRFLTCCSGTPPGRPFGRTC